MKKFFCLIAVFFMLTTGFATPAPTPTLKVGYLNMRPFVDIQHQQAQGFAFDIWDAIAKKNHWHYQLIDMGTNFDKAINSLAAKKIDVLIGPLSVTSDRVKMVDFSRPYFINRIGLVVRANDLSIGEIFTTLVLKFINIPVLFFTLIVLLTMLALWWLLRRNHQISNRYVPGFFMSMWYALIAFFGLDYKYRISTPALRFVTVLLIMLGVCISSIVVAAFSAVLTISLSHNYTDVNSIASLYNKKIAAPAGSSEIGLADNFGLRIYRVNSFIDGIQLLQQKQVFGVIENISTARAYLAEHPDLDLTVAPIILNYDETAFAFPHNSSYYNTFNIALTKMQDNEEVKPICKKYLDRASAELCSL